MSIYNKTHIIKKMTIYKNMNNYINNNNYVNNNNDYLNNKYNNEINIFLHKYNKFKYINNDKTIKETYKTIQIINNIIKNIVKMINKLTNNFNTDITNECIIKKLNKIKSKILYIDKFILKLKENKTEIDFISELENSDYKPEYIYEYKNASLYIEKYIESLIRINLFIANKMLYFDNFVNNISLLF